MSPSADLPHFLSLASPSEDLGDQKKCQYLCYSLLCLLFLLLVVRALPDVPDQLQHAGLEASHEANEAKRTFLFSLLTFISLLGSTLGCGIAYVVEFATRKKGKALPRWSIEIPKYVMLPPTVVMIFRVALDNTNAGETVTLNPDIGGIGIRLSMMISVAAAPVSLALGHFHSLESGTKELGMTQLANLTYFTVNLLKASANFRGMSYADVLVACMSITLASAALTPIVDKAEKESRKEHSEAKFEVLSATATSLYLQWVPLILVDAVCLEVTLSRLRSSEAKDVGDWGQSASWICCAAGLLHWLYICCMSLVAALDKDLRRVGLRATAAAKFRALFSFKRVRTLFSIPCKICTDDIRRDAHALEASSKTVKDIAQEWKQATRDLRTALRVVDTRGIQMSLDAGANVNDGYDDDRPNSWEVTPLHLAVSNGDFESVRLLLENGANPFVFACPGRGRSALGTAIESGNLAIVKILSKHMRSRDVRPAEDAVVSFDAQLLDSEGMLLDQAVRHKRPEIVDSLLDGIRIIPTPRAEDFEKHSSFELTPIATAIDSSDANTVHALVLHYNWKNTPDHCQSDLIARAVVCPKDRSQSHKILSMFFAAGLRYHTSQKEGFGETLLHVAAKSHPASLPLLVSKLVEDECTDRQDERGYSPLHDAVLRRDKDATIQLINLGADVNNASKRTSTTILQTAVGLCCHLDPSKPSPTRYSRESILIVDYDGPKTLVKNGLPGAFPVAEELLRILLDANVNPNIWPTANSKDSCQANPPPLTLAAKEGSLACVKMLLAKGADVNLGQYSAVPQTALHVATRNGNLEIVRKLLEAGADAAVLEWSVDEVGRTRTAVQIAQEYGLLEEKYDDIEELLKRHMAAIEDEPSANAD